MKAYRIKDWDEIFENAASRKRDILHWVPIPNSWDGLGYIRITKHKNAVSILAAWLLVVQIGSKCPQRGLLAKVDAPLSVEDMEDLTRMPAELFKKALEVLVDPNIGWVELVEITLNKDGKWDVSQINATALASNATQLAEGGLERKGREQKGTEDLPAKNLPVEPDKPSKSSRKEDDSPPDPRHMPIVKGWSEGFKKAYDRDYPFNGGRDGKALKLFLQRCKEPPEEIIATATKAWDRAKLPYSKFCRNAATLGGFCDHYPGIITELAEQSVNGHSRKISDHSKGFFAK